MVASCTASLNTKITPFEKEAFSQIAAELGLSPSAALRVFVCKFNECGGFPFSLRRENKTSFSTMNHERIYFPQRSKDGTLILPAEWYDEEGDIYDSLT